MTIFLVIIFSYYKNLNEIQYKFIKITKSFSIYIIFLLFWLLFFAVLAMQINAIDSDLICSLGPQDIILITLQILSVFLLLYELHNFCNWFICFLAFLFLLCLLQQINCKRLFAKDFLQSFLVDQNIWNTEMCHNMVCHFFVLAYLCMLTRLANKVQNITLDNMIINF